MGIPNCTKNASNVSLHYCKSGFTWKIFNIIRTKALRPFLPFLHVSESIWSPYCEQWFLQAGSYVTPREKTQCERPFASPLSMRVHVTPTLNDVIFLVLQKNIKGLQISTTRLQRERQQNNRFNKQNNNLECALHFLYISLPFLHDHNAKMPFFFVEDINKQRRNFIFLSEIGYGP